MKVLILHRSDLDGLSKENFDSTFKGEGYQLEWVTSLDSSFETHLETSENLNFIISFDLPEEIEKARQNIRLQGVPLVYVGADLSTRSGSSAPNIGMDGPLQGMDLVLPSMSPHELISQLKAFQSRIDWERSRNPLSGLPGGKVLEGKIKELFESKTGWIYYVDLNDFKAYNDSYGYQKGDNVILSLSRLLLDIVEEKTTSKSFVGHIGGDDFLLLAPEERGIGDRVAFEFDRHVSQFYTERDVDNGYITSTDREGKKKTFPLMSLVITGIPLLNSGISTVEALSTEMAKLKKIAKSRAKALHRSVFLNGADEGSSDGKTSLEEIIIQPSNPQTLKRAAIEALGELDDENAHPIFLKILQESESPMMRKSAAYGLGRLRDRKSLSHLIHALGDPSPHVRTRASEALGGLGDDRAIEPLIEVANDKNLYVRRAVVRALGKLCSDKSARQHEKKVFSLLVDKLSDRDSGVRSEAANSLGEIGRPDSISPLLDTFQNGDVQLKHSSLQALGKIESEESLPLLVRTLKDKEDVLKVASSKSLRLLSTSPQIGKSIPIPELFPLMKDKNPILKRSIALILGNVGDSSCIPCLLESLNDGSVQVRLAVISALGSLGDWRGVSPLIRLLKDPKEGIRLGAAWALGEIKNRKALEPLRICLKDVSEKVRENAALAIQKILTSQNNS
jgi:HEAT repeat protein